MKKITIIVLKSLQEILKIMKYLKLSSKIL